MRYTVCATKMGFGRRPEQFNISYDNEITENEDEIIEFESVHGAVNWTTSAEAKALAEKEGCKFEVVELHN